MCFKEREWDSLTTPRGFYDNTLMFVMIRRVLDAGWGWGVGGQRRQQRVQSQEFHKQRKNEKVDVGSDSAML